MKATMVVASIEVIPDCVLFSVLKYLSPEDQFQLRLVCKRWYFVQQAVWAATRSLRIKTQELVEPQLHVCGSHVETFSAFQILFDVQKDWRHLCAKFSTLQVLHFYGSYFETADVSKGTFNAARDLFRRDDLRALSYVNCQAVETINSVTGVETKEVCRISTKDSLSIIGHQRCLEFLEFDLRSTPSDSQTTVRELATVLEQLNQTLRGLVLYNCGLETQDLVKSLKKQSRLTQLSMHFSGVEQPMPHFLHSIAVACPALEYLCVTGGCLTAEDMNSAVHMSRLRVLVVLLNKNPVSICFDQFLSRWKHEDLKTCVEIYTDENFTVPLKRSLEASAIRVHTFLSLGLWLYDDAKLSGCLELDHLCQLERFWCFGAAKQGWKFSSAKKPVEKIRKSSDTYYDGDNTTYQETYFCHDDYDN